MGGSGQLRDGDLAAGEDPTAAVQRLRALVERTRPVSTADQRLLPVLGVLEGAFPGRGLRRGSVIQVDGAVGATSMALALAAGPTRAGSWVACVGLDEMGFPAAAEAGMAMERVAVVRSPQRSWATVMAALVDAFDVVLCALDRAPSAAQLRRLHARARERGAVLVVVGGAVGGMGAARRSWPDAADVRVVVVGAEWAGLGQGWGHLRSRRVTVQVEGRRELGRPRGLELLLPGPGGVPERAPERSEEGGRSSRVATMTPLRRVG